MKNRNEVFVAPRAGAWIETGDIVKVRKLNKVAPRAGAWIETALNVDVCPCGVSPLAQGRGLKRRGRGVNGQNRQSPLAQGRGLKLPRASLCCFSISVAPRAGAWIETFLLLEYFYRQQVAPRAGAWIETFWYLGNVKLTKVAPRAGAWIEIPYKIICC